MYYTFSGQEIEDPEMDAMRADAREITSEETIEQLQADLELVRRQRDAQQVNAEMLHDAFAKAFPEIPSFVQLSQEQVNRFHHMADLVNGSLELRDACSEPGYVWSNEECDA